MMEWWNSLSSVNQWFYLGALFFSVFFVWQLIAALIGIHGGDSPDSPDMTSHFDAQADHGAMDHTADSDAQATVDVFKLLSLRSILAFFTLFTWSGSLYLNSGHPVSLALLYSVLWGLAAMAIVSGLMYLMMKATESGTSNLATCVGIDGAVYLNIPANGQGEVRVTVSSMMTHVKARGAGGQAIIAGTPVRVLKMLDAQTIEVEPIAPKS